MKSVQKAIEARVRGCKVDAIGFVAARNEGEALRVNASN